MGELGRGGVPVQGCTIIVYALKYSAEIHKLERMLPTLFCQTVAFHILSHVECEI